MNTLFQLLPEPFDFLDQVFIHLDHSAIDVSSFELDHICYRVETLDLYHDLKTQLQELGTTLTESNINSRPIFTVKLFQPIVYKNRKIYCLELPSPKPGSFYKEGWEHVEFVIEDTLEAFLESYPKVSFDQKGLTKKVNADLKIQFPGCSVKFHEQSLEYVIKYLD